MTQQNLKVVYTCFPGGKHKALTMSYDDGRIEDRRLVEMFNEYGIRGTFNINSGLDWENMIPLNEMKTLYQGHEVACHTYQHPTIARCPIDQTAWQILWDRKTLEEAVGYPVRGLAYPNGSYDDEIKKLLPSLGIEYARTTRSTNDFQIPRDFLEWDATCHHTRNLLELGQKFVDLYKTQYLYLMYVWGHSYEFTNHNNWDLMEKFCRMVGGKEDIWYATNIQIVDYLKAAKRLVYTVDMDCVMNPNACSVWIQVDDRFLEIPGGQTVAI